VLDTLHIRNFGLIDDLTLPWKPGLNVMTGETGAGKSIIVDAMSLLLGERAASAFVRKGATQADIRALFDISHCGKLNELLESMEMDSGDEIMLRRIVNAEGKSKCYVNGAVVTRSLMSKIGAMLVDMHGQHEHQSLMKTSKHLVLLDNFAGLGADVAYIRQFYKEFKRNIAALEELVGRETTRSERVAELQEELALIDGADLRKGEEEEIKLRRNVIANSEKLHRLTSEAHDMLFAGETFQPPVVNTWDDIIQILREIAKVDRTIAKALEGYDEIRFKFDELAETLQSYNSQLEYDPAELEALEGRLETIAKLKRRHGCGSMEELLAHTDRMREEYGRLTGSSAERVKLERVVEQLREEIGQAALLLSQKRSEAASRLEQKLRPHLQDLGMPKARFEISIRQEQSPDGVIRHKGKAWKLWSTGVDRVEFFFSANLGEPPGPLRKIASGGEVSRIMLALRTVLAETDGVSLIIFDEIDSGLGASMGMPVAEKLAAVSASQQVICVTHLPQIAAMADNHIVVDKSVKAGRTHTEVGFPQGEERAREIARMLGGEASGKITLKHAHELLALVKKNR